MFLNKVFAEVCIRSPQLLLNEKLFNSQKPLMGEIITQEGYFTQCRKRIISSESSQMTEEGQNMWPFEEVRKSSIPENLPQTHHHLSPESVLPSPTLYCLPHNRPANQEMSCWGKESQQTKKMLGSCSKKAMLPELEFKFLL